LTDTRPLSDITTGEGARGKLLRWIVPGSIFLLAAVVRGLPYHAVIVGDRIVFFGFDAYYHMRRVFYALDHFPEVIEFDPYLNFPEGAQVIWPPFFDGMIALALLPFHRMGQPDAVERVAIWIPPLLGAATVLALFHLAKRTFGRAVATISALILSLLSGHYWYSQLGFIDHHAAVSLVSTLLLASSMGLMRRLAVSPKDRRSLFVGGGLVAMAAACILMLWPGSILYVGLVEIGLLVFLLSRPSRDEAVAAAQALCFTNALAFTLILPFAAFNSWPQWGDFSSVVLTRFQPWFFGVLAVYGSICAVFWRWGGGPGIGGTPRARIAQGVLIGLSVLGMSLLLFPGVARGIVDAWMWLSKANSFQASVAESAPLFVNRGELSVAIAELRLSRFVYLFPFGILALMWSARTRRDGASLLLFAGWSIALFVITILQKRFFNTFSVALALTAGWSCVTVFERLREHIDSKGRRKLAAAALAAAAIWLLAPSFAAYSFDLDNHLRASRGELVRYQDIVVWKARTHVTAEWLRDHTPATSGYLDPQQMPEYAVLGPWMLGHVLTYVGQRPTVLGNFGDDVGMESFSEAMGILDQPPKEAIPLLEKRGVRYLVLWLTQQSSVDTRIQGLRIGPGRSAVRSQRSRRGRRDLTGTPNQPRQKARILRADERGRGGALPLPLALRDHRQSRRGRDGPRLSRALRWPGGPRLRRRSRGIERRVGRRAELYSPRSGGTGLAGRGPPGRSDGSGALD